MGEKLSKFYEKANEIGGMKARMRLAILTNISSVKAAQEPDSEENVKKFEAAIVEISKENQ